MSQATVFKLKCATQTFGWGKLGANSEVASLSRAGNPDFIVDDKQTYAELWMGTHPKGPSVLDPEDVPLTSWLEANPTALGDKVSRTFPNVGQLPFLFKVLSVNKALSIQAHPNKVLAEKLHALNPDKYPDPNHKPEMAIALTPFEGLCGFRPKQEIVGFMENISEFRSLVGEGNAESLSKADDVGAEQEALRECFSALMKCDPHQVRSGVEKVAARFSEARLSGRSTENVLGDLFLRINSQFPGDCGCFCIYFLNYMKLNPGQALYLDANTPHAYLAGDCMECMACSDNVVRAGLTPKFKDVPTLCSMLNYTCKPAEDNIFASVPDAQDKYVTIYDPPVQDFTVARIQLPSGVSCYNIGAVDSASILLVIQGSATTDNDTVKDVHRGTVLFISAGESLDLNVDSDGMLMFRAYCPL